MSLKRFGVTLLAVFVLGAIMASSAYATNEFKEPGSAWYTGASPGTKLAAGTTQTVNMEATGHFSFESTLSGSPVDVTATGVQCVSCTISNVGTQAHLNGRLKFTGVSLSEPDPTTCAVTAFETKALTAVVGMNTAGTKSTLKFVPETGTTLASFQIVQSGLLPCTGEGLFKLTGTIFGEAANATGVFAVGQEIKFSRAIQESAGELNSLMFGPNAGILTGALRATLASGTEWAAKEK
jgi:hypothetical protein